MLEADTELERESKTEELLEEERAVGAAACLRKVRAVAVAGLGAAVGVGDAVVAALVERKVRRRLGRSTCRR